MSFSDLPFRNTSLLRYEGTQKALEVVPEGADGVLQERTDNDVRDARAGEG